MKTVGETLRTAREKKNLDIEYVSDALKIRAKYLTALEEGNYDIFPSSLYIKGFLKNYVKLLGLDEEGILALYRREYSGELKKDEIPVLPSTLKTVRFVLKPTHVIYLFTAIVVFFICLYLFYEYKTFSAPPFLEVDAPANNQTVATSSILVTGKTSTGNKLTINGNPVPFIDDNGDFSTTVTLQSNINELIISASNSLNRTTTIDRTVIYDTKAQVSGSATPTTTPDITTMNARLVINNDNTLIKLVVDGNEIINGVLSPGAIKTFTAQKTIMIQTGRPSDTILSVNGKSIDLSGTGIFIEKTIQVDQNGNITVQ